jgi:hypothetical protein
MGVLPRGLPLTRFLTVVQAAILVRRSDYNAGDNRLGAKLTNARLEGAPPMPRQTMNEPLLSHHILPNASTMLGVCLTGIGLVKLAEVHLGPSHVDEYLAIDAVCFMVSCMCSYASIRRNGRGQNMRNRLEQIADYFFMIGLVAMTFISVLFAYEFV